MGKTYGYQLIDLHSDHANDTGPSHGAGHHAIDCDALGLYTDSDEEAAVTPPKMKRHWASRTAARRAVRRRRLAKSNLKSMVKLGMLGMPAVLLMFFGILHLMETLLGRTSLLWNAETIVAASWQRATISGSEGRKLIGNAHPIPCHSHNDYLQRRPLLDALSWGFTGVEADVWLFDNNLYVGHHKAALSRTQTFRSTYIDPLIDILTADMPEGEAPRCTGDGIYKVAPAQTLTLLVDLKTDGDRTLQHVVQQTAKLREMGCLSYWNGSTVVPREITLVATGNAPYDAITANATYRDIFYDAPLHALWETPHSPISNSSAVDAGNGKLDYGAAMATSQDGVNPNYLDFNASTSYYASTSFLSSVGFVWRGHLSPRQMEVVRGQIRGAKRRGLKARYWDVPTWPTSVRNHIWHVLVKEGADVLSVDDLAAAAMQDWTVRVHDTSFEWFAQKTPD
ncbi:hypothetical protein NU195Hw_g761t1 [Hortaea werneckii]